MASNGDIIFLSVIIVVVAVTTFVCQTFAKLFAERIFALCGKTTKNQVDEEAQDSLQRHSTFSSNDESYYSSSEFKKGKKLASNKIKMAPTKVTKPRYAPASWKGHHKLNLRDLYISSHDDPEKFRRRKRTRRSIRRHTSPHTSVTNNNLESETFLRLGIPPLGVPLQHTSFMKKLEDQNLSPIYQTSSDSDSCDVNNLGNVAKRLDFKEALGRDSLRNIEFWAGRYVVGNKDVISPKDHKTCNDSYHHRKKDVSLQIENDDEEKDQLEQKCSNHHHKFFCSTCGQEVVC